MIAIVRITGDVKIKQDIRETFKRMGLTRKYSCVVLENPKPEELGMLYKVRDLVAFGEINQETFKKLVEARGYKGKTQSMNKNKMSKEKKIKKHIFRLHPPRKGIDSKLHFGQKKGVLGDNKEKINELIERML